MVFFPVRSLKKMDPLRNRSRSNYHNGGSQLAVVCHRMPLNVRGRTGLTGRGVLGRYGPNHAVDPIVTRWKTHPEGGIIHDKISSRPVLQFVAVQRRDTNEWALPGGT